MKIALRVSLLEKRGMADCPDYSMLLGRDYRMHRPLLLTLCNLLALYAVPFVNAQSHSSQEEIRIAFLSCAQQPESAAWRTLAQEKPDYLFMLGDNVYVEDSPQPSLSGIRQRYQHLFSNPDFLALKTATRLYAIWDDHDFGPNNFDSRFAGLEPGKQLFREFFGPLPNPPGFEGTSVFSLNLPGFLVIGTDNRSFRLNPGTDKATMFGTRQLRWIEETIRITSSRTIVFLSGDQILPATGKTEALGKYPNEQRRLLQVFENSPAQVYILSGDTHYADMHMLRTDKGAIYEFTSSPFSGPTDTKHALNLEPTRVGVNRWSANYGLLTLDLKHRNARVEFKDPQGRPLLGANIPRAP